MAAGACQSATSVENRCTGPVMVSHPSTLHAPVNLIKEMRNKRTGPMVVSCPLNLDSSIFLVVARERWGSHGASLAQCPL
eukprot:1156184-Pelagomonas_calceolata.AAC.17